VGDVANCKDDVGWPRAVHEVSKGKVVVYGVFFLNESSRLLIYIKTKNPRLCNTTKQQCKVKNPKTTSQKRRNHRQGIMELGFRISRVPMVRL